MVHTGEQGPAQHMFGRCPDPNWCASIRNTIISQVNQGYFGQVIMPDELFYRSTPENIAHLALHGVVIVDATRERTTAVFLDQLSTSDTLPSSSWTFGALVASSTKQIENS